MNCPRGPLIPVYLFVGGSFGLIKLIQIIWVQWRTQRSESMSHEFNDIGDETGTNVHPIGGFNGNSRCIDLSISLFLMIWFCLGNYWVRN